MVGEVSGSHWSGTVLDWSCPSLTAVWRICCDIQCTVWCLLRCTCFLKVLLWFCLDSSDVWAEPTSCCTDWWRFQRKGSEALPETNEHFPPQVFLSYAFFTFLVTVQEKRQWFWILWRCHLNHSFMISSSWSSELQALIFMLRHMQTLVLCKQTCIFLQLFPCVHHFFHEDLIVPLRCTLRDNSLHVVTLTNTFISILVLQVKSFTSNFNELTLHSTIY